MALFERSVRDLASLLLSVHWVFAGLTNGTASVPENWEEIENPSSAQVCKSITPDAIISFIDGKAYKTMKRHLGTHGLDPHSYRQCYGLPSDYPMVAPNYAAQRSALAKSIGLGRPGSRA
ncbi:MucR family transcriptional regulator [Methylobacterium gnaphalii]|uniref:MucR family transcriptional regulator n=1 Tax=Methylobacterium gnaphalii TaxID=1010610 RepID=UPI001EE25C9D|nr:MucR family transcriptional regulator [Methylobacterium gnaphalii]GJD70059.1 Transcriptional regulatory protein ros [Methylobacterium gnaphalii]